MKSWIKYASLAVTGLFLAACGGKEEPVVPGEEPQPEKKVLELSLSPSSTAEDPSWQVADKVRVFLSEGNGRTLTKGSDGKYSDGVTLEDDQAGYLVLSPNAEAHYDGSLLQVAYPSRLNPVAGSVPADLAFAAGRSNGKAISLEPLFSGFVLRFEREDVTAVTLRSQGGEKIAGLAHYRVSDWKVQTVTGGADAIEARSAIGFLEPGKDWVVTLPPIGLSKGYSLTVETSAGSYEYADETPITLYRGSFLRVQVPDNLVPPKPKGLKSLIIKTPNGAGIYSKEAWTENCEVKLADSAGNVYYQSSTVAMKGRGNSTWSYPKKPYTLKLPMKADLIGTGADKRWVLLANWMDRTLLRNDVAFEIARRCSGLEWTPSGEFVELYLNGEHQGNYWLGEKIKTGKARVQADFIIEMDTYYDAQWRFYSSYGRRVNENATGMPIGVKEPDDDEMTLELFNTLKGLVSGVEKALYQNSGKWQEKMDVNSFVDWYLVHELTYNGEPNHPKSCYFYFRDGVMYAGPVWDFDWFTFQPNTSGLLIRNSIYYQKLFQQADFVAALKTRWAALKPLLATIPDYIDAKAEEIGTSESQNWNMWPCTSSGVNGDEWMSYSQAISRLKNAFTARLKVVDSAISAL